MGKKKWLSLQQTVWIALGLGLGLVFGLIMPEFFYTPLNVIATIYMSSLKMMIFPLVFCSLLTGIMGIGSIAKTGKIGLYSLLWFTATTLFASALGLFLPGLLHLGAGAQIVATDVKVDAVEFKAFWELWKISFPPILLRHFPREICFRCFPFPSLWDWPASP